MRLRLRLPPAVNNEQEEEEAAAWKHLLEAIGGYDSFDPAITMHPMDCTCGSVQCQRLLAVRRYVKAHINARRIRFAHQALQERWDDFVKDENERTVELDHAEALKMLETELPF
jgi:hypothetical protein